MILGTVSKNFQKFAEDPVNDLQRAEAKATIASFPLALLYSTRLYPTLTAYPLALLETVGRLGVM